MMFDFVAFFELLVQILQMIAAIFYGTPVA